MTRIVIKELIWDKWNSEHIQKHKITVLEVETVAKNLIAHEKAKEGRYAVFGRVGSRILTLIIKREKQSVYYLITARDAAKKERKNVYEKEEK
jgi:uncharacterized DUF497 family protein